MERIDVSILGRDYSLACMPAEKDALLAAVRHVDQRMLGVKGSAKGIRPVWPVRNRPITPVRKPPSFRC